MVSFGWLQTQKDVLLLDCISGSRAYNLALPSSDTDKKGVFILPQKQLFGFEQPAQLNNESNDEVYFELKRFLELLLKNNPNILELLNSPNDCILYKHPLLDRIKPEDFLSKLCLDTFAGYAASQIKKARGLNKKIHKAFEEERRSILNFCHVVQGNGSIPLQEWLSAHRFRQEECGLSKLPHFKDVYLLYHQQQLKQGERFAGIASGSHADDVQLSAVPKGIEPLVVMNFNKDAYSVYCREFREYWDWVNKRNETRYQNTLSHGRNYDSKNMMHTFRLLAMAEEIARDKEIRVYRQDREFLLKIRAGEFEYDDLMARVEEKLAEIRSLYENCTLPDAPDASHAENLLIQIREEFYQSKKR